MRKIEKRDDDATREAFKAFSLFRLQIAALFALCCLYPLILSHPLPPSHLPVLFTSPHLPTASSHYYFISLYSFLTIFYICGAVQQIPTRSRDTTCPYYCLYCPCFRLEIVRARFHPKVIEGERGEWSGAEARRKKKRGKVVGRSNIIYFLILTLSFFFFFFLA